MAGLPPALNSSLCISTPGGERRCESKVCSPRTQRNVPGARPFGHHASHYRNGERMKYYRELDLSRNPVMLHHTIQASMASKPMIIATELNVTRS